MAAFFQSVRQGFGRGGNKNNNNNNNNANTNANANTTNVNSNIPSYPKTSSGQSTPQLPMQPPNQGSISNGSSAVPTDNVPTEREPVKYFFQEKYAPLNVKGNFLTLCACPKNVELGEWLAHQIVEQNRLLHGMLQVVQEVNLHTGVPICNELTCPTMSAGNLTYTWLVDGRAAKISAPKFINRVEKWIVSKIHDPLMFPTEQVTTAPITFAIAELTNTSNATRGNPGTNNELAAQDWIGKSSGFPPTFYKDCQGIMKQMFRCYAHLYHAHWESPFWHINKHEVLNMCFVHFVTVSKYYKLVADKEMEPMQPLIDIYIKQEKIPPEALAGHWAQQPAAASASSQA